MVEKASSKIMSSEGKMEREPGTNSSNPFFSCQIKCSFPISIARGDPATNHGLAAKGAKKGDVWLSFIK
jgi:hypothetical protein